MPARHRGDQGHRRGEAGGAPRRRFLSAPLQAARIEGRFLTRARTAVTAAYAAQGLGYAVVVTSLPALKQRQSVDDTVVTLIVLGVAVTAALGSILADLVAVRRGSRWALVTGLALQGLSLPLIALPTAFPVFLAAFAVFGIGLGCVDAAAAMQAVAVQRRRGRPLLGRFFATATAAAIVGALLVSAVAATALAAGIVLAAAGLIALAVAATGIRHFDREPAVADTVPRAERRALPRAGIWALGLIILAAFVVDSAVSTWSTVYLADELRTAAWLAPLGYAAYQAMVLLTRLLTDRLVSAIGRRRLAFIAVLTATLGCLVVAVIPSPATAIAGFALAGVATGALVPVTFGAAGDLDPAHADQVIARVNLFNYAGAVLGAVGVGVLAEGIGLGLAFALPAVLLLVALSVLRRLGARASSGA